MIRHYILDGHTPVEEPDLLTWARWIEKGDCVVRQDKLGGVLVSTIFLGTDHSWSLFDGPDAVPILFETGVFEEVSHRWPGGRLRRGLSDLEMHRYATWDEAEAGHAEVLEKIRAMLAVADAALAAVFPSAGADPRPVTVAAGVARADGLAGPHAGRGVGGVTARPGDGGAGEEDQEGAGGSDP